MMTTKRIVRLLFLPGLGTSLSLAQTYRVPGSEWSHPLKLLLGNPGDFPRRNEGVVLRLGYSGELHERAKDEAIREEARRIRVE